MISDRLKLFDDVERTYLGPSKRSEAQWEYLNRTARPEFQYIRELLQSWFNEFNASPDKRKALCKTFRSLKDDEHLSAFFELYLYQLFKNQNFEIEVEPEWEQGKPDFLLTSSDGKKILLEATATYPDREFGEAKKLEEMVLDHLDEFLDSPDFFMHIKIVDSPKNPPPYAQIRRYLQKQLKDLNYDRVMQDANENKDSGLKRFPSILWKHDTWSIEFEIIPKKGEARGKAGVRPLGLMSYGVEWIDSASGIKSSIDKKNAHYGELDIPYILALNVLDTFADEDDVTDALFGQQTLTLSPETDEVFNSRQSNGAWFGPNGYQKKRMSGIYVFKQLRPMTMHIIKDPVIWHHPYANNPLEPDLINVSQKIPNNLKGVYELREGMHPKELLRLDETRMSK